MFEAVVGTVIVLILGAFLWYFAKRVEDIARGEPK